MTPPLKLIPVAERLPGLTDRDPGAIADETEFLLCCTDATHAVGTWNGWSWYDQAGEEYGPVIRGGIVTHWLPLSALCSREELDAAVDAEHEREAMRYAKTVGMLQQELDAARAEIERLKQLLSGEEPPHDAP